LSKIRSRETVVEVSFNTWGFVTRNDIPNDLCVLSFHGQDWVILHYDGRLEILKRPDPDLCVLILVADFLFVPEPETVMLGDVAYIPGWPTCLDFLIMLDYKDEKLRKLDKPLARKFILPIK
jgi:hypothetical protein